MCASSPSLLENLLDVSNLHNQTQISRRFLEIAESILSFHCLRVEYEGTSTDFEILEIEFYLRKEGLHEDPFCHAHHEQKRSAQWYFHRAPTKTAPAGTSNAPTDAGGYRGGSRKGLDLTFGTPVTSPSPMPQGKSLQACGGILLRSMRSMDGSRTVTSGPSLLVDKILAITKSRNTAELVNTKLGGCISALSPKNDERASMHSTKLYLAARSRQPNAHAPIIHRSPRVGLDLTHPSVVPERNNDRVQFISKLYRHFVHPELLKSNGRYHTFIGMLLEQHSAESTTSESLQCPILRAQLIKITMLKRATIERYMEDYTQGFLKRSLSEYVGSAGQRASSNPQVFMRMMGVLRRMGLLTASDEDLVTVP